MPQRLLPVIDFLNRFGPLSQVVPSFRAEEHPDRGTILTHPMTTNNELFSSCIFIMPPMARMPLHGWFFLSVFF